MEGFSQGEKLSSVAATISVTGEKNGLPSQKDYWKDRFWSEVVLTYMELLYLQ